MLYLSSSPLVLLATRLVLLFLAFATSFQVVSANTEIRNFHVGPASRHPASSSFSDARLSSSHISVTTSRALLRTYFHTHPYALNETHNEHSFRVKPAPFGTSLLSVCEDDVDDRSSGGGGGGSDQEAMGGCLNEVWLELELDGEAWRGYNDFTVRLSWPAFYPADFDITVISPEELEGYIHSRFGLSNSEEVPFSGQRTYDSRTKYTRIRLVDTGVRAPSNIASSSSFHGTAQVEVEAVPFTIIIEPLLLGIIPASLVPTILFLIPLLGLVYLMYPHVLRYLEGVADEARKELYGVERKRQ